MKEVRVGIIGVGNMGTSHCKWITGGEVPGMKLCAVCDIKQSRLDWVKENISSDIAFFTNYINLLESGLIDAVIIATPHYYHPQMAVVAFARNIHVMTEKPAGVFTKQVREMNEAAKKSDCIFGIMYNQRTIHYYRKMREIIKSGELGEIKRINWIITDWYRSQAYYNSGGWRATWAGEGGGVLINQCPHNLDLWQWICGMPTKVRAFCHEGKWHDIEVEDDVTAYVEYANGATGVFITTTADCPGTNRFEVTLEGGKLICENGKLEMYKNSVNEREFNKTNTELFGKPEVVQSFVETDGVSTNHVGVLRAFVAAINNGEPLIADGVEGINGLTISNAIHLSSWLDKTIELPIDEELYFAELNKRITTSKIKNTEDLFADTKGTY